MAEAEASVAIDEVDKEEVVGVDPITMNMDVKTFYEHLLHLYAGDREKVRAHLNVLPGCGTFQRGFTETSYFSNVKAYDLMTRESQEELCAELAKLSTAWAASGIVTTARALHELITDTKIRQSYFNSIVLLQYHSTAYGARFWHNKWAKEMRGTVLFVNPESLEVRVLSYKLPRGAEAVTGMTTRTGVETQDVKASMIKVLDLEQQDTCRRLCTVGGSIDMDMTSKGDGSLLVINKFTGIALSIFQPVIEIFGSEYIKLWMEQSMRLSGGSCIYFPSTQGTVMESRRKLDCQMKPYMVTAMLVGGGIVASRDHLSHMTPLQAWGLHGEDFIKKLMLLKTFNHLSHTHTFSFEAMCRNRRGLFDDREHIELAVRYDRDRLIFLGMSVADCRFYVHHCACESVIPGGSLPFEEPLWWRITEVAQVDAMIDDLGLLILGKVDKGDFLAKFPPKNATFDVSSAEHVSNAVIDYEGWVAMKTAALEITDMDHLAVTADTGLKSTIYSKIKSEAYYRAHKFHSRNIPYLMDLAITAGHIFPLANMVAAVAKPGAIASRLRDVGERVLGLLDFKDPLNKVLEELRASFAVRLEEAKVNMAKGSISKLPKDPLGSFGRVPFDVQCKIVLNTAGFDISVYLIPIYLAVFPELDASTPDLKEMTKSLTMMLEPWRAGYEERIQVLNPKSPAVQGLMQAWLGAGVM